MAHGCEVAGLYRAMILRERRFTLQEIVSFLHIVDIIESRTCTVVRECCKDDDQCQWEKPKFDPLPPLNP